MLYITYCTVNSVDRSVQYCIVLYSTVLVAAPVYSIIAQCVFHAQYNTDSALGYIVRYCNLYCGLPSETRISMFLLFFRMGKRIA